MDFGKVPQTVLDKIDFRLADEPEWNRTVLKGKKVTEPKVFFGCPQWWGKDWIGKLYPKGTRDTELLDHYVRHFNAIELNATHYKVYEQSTIRKWAAKAKDRDFRFCPKMFKDISHLGSLHDKQALTAAFLQSISAFEDKLGPVFIQLSEHFSWQRKGELFTYLSALPADFQFFLEMRNTAWFGKDESRELFELLRSLGMGAVITDTAGRRDCAHMHLPVPRAFVRFVTNELHPTDYTRCDAWVKRISYWLEQGLEELYFFIHSPDEATSPEIAVYFIDKLNQACGLNLPKPRLNTPGTAQQATQQTIW